MGNPLLRSNTPLIEHLQGRERALEVLGCTGREAQWIALVYLHTGVFTRAQFCFHLKTSRMTASRFVRRLVDQGFAGEDPMPPRFDCRQLGRPPSICRISHWQIYEVLEAENIRRRKITSTEVLLRALFSLDYVLEHPELAWLPTEREKVRCFETLGLDRRLLPSRLYQGAVERRKRYFALKLPSAVDSETATFVYVDPGHQTNSGLRFWGETHQRLWAELKRKGLQVQVVAIAQDQQAIARAGRVLRGWANRPPARVEQGAGELTQDDPSVAQEMERIRQAILKADRRLLAEYGAGGISFNPAMERYMELEKLPKTRATGRVSIDSYTSWRPRRFSKSDANL